MRRPTMLAMAFGAGGLLALAGVAALAQQQQQQPAAGPAAYTPGPQNVTLPPDWERRFIRYSVVDNAQDKRVVSVFINPEAFEALRPGQPIPYGTILVVVAQRARLGRDGNPLLDQQGRFIPEPDRPFVGVQQKERGWGEGYGPDRRNGEWEYARFNADGTRNNGPVDACFACHLQNRAQQDFTFTAWDYAQARR